MSELEAFGYRPVANTFNVFSISVAEAKDGETLQPMVLLLVRLDIPPDAETMELGIPRADDVDPVDGRAATEAMVFPIPVEFVEELVSQLEQYAAIARAKHFEQGDSDGLH